MTTPNEDLILKLRGQAYTTCRPDQLCDRAADLLQSQAERIKELEEAGPITFKSSKLIGFPRIDPVRPGANDHALIRSRGYQC